MIKLFFSAIGSKIKLYSLAIGAFAVTAFLWAFKARGDKIKKQKKVIAGHESNKRITDTDKTEEVGRRNRNKKTKEATADELVKKANSRNRNK